MTVEDTLERGLRPITERRPRPVPVTAQARVVSNTPMGGRNYRLVLAAGEIARTALPGQFVMVTIPDGPGRRFLLPRPMAIHRRRQTAGTIDLVVKAAGPGTAALAAIPAGASLGVTGPLGRGFDITAAHRSVLLIGRGIGVCALMTVAEEARDRGAAVRAVLSAQRMDSVIGGDDARDLGVAAMAVDDASGTSAPAEVGRSLRSVYGEHGPDAIMVCGSDRLTKLAAELGGIWDADLQVSVEAHMACGMGYCHGCVLPGPTAAGREGLLACADGPVFAFSPEPSAARA